MLAPGVPDNRPTGRKPARESVWKLDGEEARTVGPRSNIPVFERVKDRAQCIQVGRRVRHGATFREYGETQDRNMHSDNKCNVGVDSALFWSNADIGEK